MTAQPDPRAGRTGFNPPMSTPAQLREALSTWGFPGDPQRFEEELDAADLDDLTQVRKLTQAYRHRVLLRFDPEGSGAPARSTEDVTAELRLKMAEAGTR